MTRAEAERQAGLPVSAPIRAAEPGLDARAVMQLIAKALGVSISQIVGPSQEQEITSARKCICHVLRAKGLSYSAIGRRIGVNHSTVIGHVKSFDAATEKRPELRIVAAAFALARPIGAAAADLQRDAERITGLIASRLSTAELRKREKNIAAAKRSAARRRQDDGLGAQA